MQTSLIPLMLHYFMFMMTSHEAVPSTYITADRN